MNPFGSERSIVRNRLVLLALWFVFYASYTLITPPLLDDADSVHAEVAREMIVRHDWVTLYANGIRYLEKAPLLYWGMATSFKIFGVHTGAARLPLAFAVLALALALESFARRAFGAARAGLYAGLMVLSSFGVFIFTRITIPDAMVCLWLTLGMYCYWLTDGEDEPRRVLCWGFAVCCALNVLTKGLIGAVFPVGIVGIHLVLTRGWRGAIARLRRMHVLSSVGVFLVVAAPWHVLIGLANPAQGHPGGWLKGEPTDGNVHGWFWFYFVNEHLLRYLNLRVPRDYDTVPLVLFWGLLLVWMMPWSGFLFTAVRWCGLVADRTRLLMVVWAGFVLVFFSLSTRQEYYVLPALPALMMLVAGWLEEEAAQAEAYAVPGRLVAVGQRISVVMLVMGSAAALVAGFFVLHAQTPGPNTDLSSLLKQNPGEYALSFGHFLDLNGQAMGAFRDPLMLAAVGMFVGALGSWLCRRDWRPHAGNLCLAAGTFVFLLAAHLGLQIFSPVLSSRALAEAIRPVLKADDLIVIHGEYESGSTLGFYLRRDDLHILEGRSSNLWYGSFFPDAPRIFEDEGSLGKKWMGPGRVFLWTEPEHVPKLPGQVFFVAQSGGKEIVSNREIR